MLKISARGEYALLLAKYLLAKEGVEKISGIAQQMAVSESLIRKIANDLEHAGIVRSQKGRGGWIAIAKREISVHDVLLAVWEDLSLTVCTGSGPCGLEGWCTISPLIRNLQRWIDSILKITKL